MAFEKVHVLTMLVNNNFGVLARVAALIRREGCNIKNLTTMQTEDVMVSRLLLSVECHNVNLQHIVEKLSVLGTVEQMAPKRLSGFVCREMALIQLHGPIGEQERELLEQSGATVLPESETAFQITAQPQEVDRLTDALSDCCRCSVVRSGAVALELESSPQQDV